MAVADFPRVNADTVIRDIPLADVEVGPNIRHEPGDLQELAASIREHGVLQPVKVIERPGGKYRLVWGQRRLLASRLAERETIPAIVVPPSDLDAAGPNRSIEQLVENLLRADLNPMDEARALREVLDANGRSMTQVSLAQRLGRSAPWVASTLGLLKLDDKVQGYIADGQLTTAHGKALMGLPAKDQRALAKGAVERGESAHDVERQAKWERERQAEADKRSKASEDAAARALAALHGAETPAAATVFVSAPWPVDAEVVRKAIAAAGYTLGEGWPRDRGKNCDCTAIRVEIHDGKGTSVKGVCIVDAHWQALAEERDREARAKHELETRQQRELETRQQRELEAAIVAAFDAHPLEPTLARLIARWLDSYQGKAWKEYEALEPGEIHKRLASRMVNQAYGAKPLPHTAVLELLGAVPAGEAVPKPKNPRRRPVDGPAGHAPAAAAAGDSPICSCGKPKVAAGEDRFVCTNPDHPTGQA